MAMDENNLGGEGEKEQTAQTPAASEPASASPAQSASELADRKNAAKAFYRAMYAGGEPEPEDFGMNTKTSGAFPPHQQSGPCGNCARLESENKELEKAKNESDGYYKRVVADFENYRRRTDKEREESVALGVQKALEAILPALDDLERAKQMLGSVTDPRAVTESLNLLFGRFSKCLESQGVKPMEVIGVPFDPKFHEPVQEVETNEFPDGAVMQELRRGYIMKDKVIRPSLVNVASNSSGIVIKKEAAAPAASSEAAVPPPPPPAPPVATASPEPEPEAVPAPTPTPVNEVTAPEPTPAPSPEAVATPAATPAVEPTPAPAPASEATPTPEAAATVEAAAPAAVSAEAAAPAEEAKVTETVKKHEDESTFNMSATADVPVYNAAMFESLTADEAAQLAAVDKFTKESDQVFEIPEQGSPNAKSAGELAESAATHKKVVDE